MPNYIFGSTRQRVAATAAQYGFAVRLKAEARRLKKPLNRGVYCRNQKTAGLDMAVIHRGLSK